MRQLIRKEFMLTASPLTYLFLAFALMTLIPGYPILVGAFFMCLGLFYTFQFAREYNDVIYTALLPVAKSDVVRARIYFVVVLQSLEFVMCLILTLVRMFSMSDSEAYLSNVLMNANFVYLGDLLFIFALFLMIFVTGFFKTAFYYGKSFLWFCVTAFLVIGIAETVHHIPGMEFLNTCGTDHLGIQLAVLGAGVIVYVAAVVFTLKKAIHSFDQIDLCF